MMNVLILGSGGREHTFAWKLAQSAQLNKLYIAPGNAGTMLHGENLPINLSDKEAVKNAVLHYAIDMVVAGPEAPLVEGMADFFKNDSKLSKIKFIGPSADGAKLEGSKDHAKAFLARHRIPTAAYQTFDKHNIADAYVFLESLKPPYVLKADGLAAGKGVLILQDIDSARSSIKEMIEGEKFGSASAKVVIEEFLDGIELSVFVLNDGTNYVILPEAKDYKRIGDNDTGLNTGGMGAVSPVPFADKSFMQKVESRIVKPTVVGLKKDGVDYKGFIFIGLMKVGDDPIVIEYNVRMGDPETEAVLPRVNNDLLDVFHKLAEGRLNEVEIDLSTKTAVTVMAVAGGYPGTYNKGEVIHGLDLTEANTIFHAGTTIVNDQIVTNGGRVFAVTSLSDSIGSAASMCYKQLQKINFRGMYYRKDIGKDLIRFEEKV